MTIFRIHKKSGEVIKIKSPKKIFKARGRVVRRGVCLKYGVTSVLLMAAFIAGFVRVYVNTYNIMYDDKMVVFSIDKTEHGTSLTILNHVIELT